MKKKLLLLVCTICCISLSHAQWTQTGADIDGEAAEDALGRNSVSMSADGSILAVGAHLNDGNGSDAGHVRIYKNENGAWTQIGTDIEGVAAADNFGWAVSLNAAGNIVAIGAPYNDGSGVNSGHVRVYRNVNNTWTQVGADIQGEANFDLSGNSVSMSADGNTVAIGAEGNGATLAGHARIFTNVNDTWVQVGSDIDGEAANDRSGWRIGLSADGTIVAISAFQNDGNGVDSGHVRVFRYANNTWTQIGSDIDGETASDKFGSSLSLSEDGLVVAIGSIWNFGNGTNAGHVRVFRNINDTWTQIGADIDGAPFDRAGGSVELSYDGNIVAVGSLGGTGLRGFVSIYKNENDAWVQVGADILGESINDHSGASLGFSDSGGAVAIGTGLNDGNGNDAGHVRVFGNPTLSVNDVALQNLTVYPNPANTTVFVQSKTRIETITIFDGRGTQIKTMTPTEIQGNYPIDVSDLATGFYFMTLQSGTSSQTKKFMKN